MQEEYAMQLTFYRLIARMELSQPSLLSLDSSARKQGGSHEP